MVVVVVVVVVEVVVVVVVVVVVGSVIGTLLDLLSSFVGAAAISQGGNCSTVNKKIITLCHVWIINFLSCICPRLHRYQPKINLDWMKSDQSKAVNAMCQS